MANIKVDKLYINHLQQMLHDITDGEMNTVQGSVGGTVTAIVNELNDPSLAHTLEQNLDNLLFQLRNQMGIAVIATRTMFNEGFNFY
jgi:hypothetical protein